MTRRSEFDDARERRTTAEEPEFRAAEDRIGTAAGRAALFNVTADIGGYFQERLLPGAFTESLAVDDVRALFDHDPGRVLGRSSAGTLRLSEDAAGLSCEIDLPDTSDGRDLVALLRRRDITGMSFGFEVMHDEWDDSGDIPLRTIHRVKLWEVSAVTWPAYSGTSIAMRSLEEARKAVRASNYRFARARVAERRARQEARFRGL